MRIRLAALALVIAGIFFVLYPPIRPFSDETTLLGAQAFASTAWLVAHMLAMLGFTLAALGLLGLYLALRDSAVDSLAFWAMVIFWLGVGRLSEALRDRFERVRLDYPTPADEVTILLARTGLDGSKVSARSKQQIKLPACQLPFGEGNDLVRRDVADAEIVRDP